MSEPLGTSGDTTAPDEERARLQQQAETAAESQDWDTAVDRYRRLLAFGPVAQAAENKLLWAQKMRTIDALYKQGRSQLAAKRYAEALAALRQARLLYANHFKDTDALIVEAQRAMQKQNWQVRTGADAKRRGCWMLGALLLVMGLALGACSSPAPENTSTTSTGSAAKLSPLQRSNMYKSEPPMTIDTSKKYVATIKTAKGSIVAELYPKDAPKTVNNFVFLARDGFYSNLTFHRVVPGFVIQGGDPSGDGSGGPGYNIGPEIKSKHSKGAMAMARRGGPAQTTPSSGSQFYITLAPQPNLDGEYTVFGQVTQGMDIVEKIAVGDVIQSVSIEEK